MKMINPGRQKTLKDIFRVVSYTEVSKTLQNKQLFCIQEFSRTKLKYDIKTKFEKFCAENSLCSSNLFIQCLPL